MKLSYKWKLHPALRLPMGAAVIVGFISLCFVAYIEDKALYQPDFATPVYPYPHHIKGVIRYFTDTQERIWSAAHPVMLGSFAIVLMLIVASLVSHARTQRKSN
jgi:hypothetical protein